ncbi:hypothetical protein fugu_019172 [Takifugu bimaculatus]|uniref:G-protein coupled receptors family 1 profile domain-containing protein n=1 Tax=Takifugu bimaculatus TaxID=433685 RepID=A0A4Z2BLQ2_9TELE|nr:hypothetical protein fugu_019172 [Takifugu bimaculatus]
MAKHFVFFFILVLCLSATLQKEGKKRRKVKRNSSEVAHPRTFLGVPEKGSILFALNGTQAPVFSNAPPALALLSNITKIYLDGPLSTRVIPIIYILAMAVGMPANIAILCMLATKLRKVSSAILYCSLAVSDLLLLLSLSFKTYYHLHGNNWAFSEDLCRLVTACFYGNLYCSAQTLACISIKRYIAVVHPFLYKGLPKRTCATWMTVAVWGVFAAGVTPELLVQQSYWIPEVNRTTCHDVLPLKESTHVLLLHSSLFLTIFCLLLPLVVTIVCYSRIICELNRSHHDWSVYIKASSLVFVIFLVCFTPAGVLQLSHQIQLFLGTEGLYMYFKAAVCLCCLHACLDPFLFVLMSKSAGSRLNFKPFVKMSVSLSA